jgi:hypothetical protein
MNIKEMDYAVESGRKWQRIWSNGVHSIIDVEPLGSNNTE